METKKQIREDTLATVMPELKKRMITKAVEKHKGRFSPKYQAFNILRNKVEEVVTKRKLLWKVIYGLSTRAMEEKGDQEKENTSTTWEKEDATKEKDEMAEENAQDA